MVIVGIDPGSQVAGYGVVRVTDGTVEHMAHGTLESKKKSSLSRIGEIAQKLSGVLDEYQPEQASLESIFLGKNVKSAFMLGQARGAIAFELAKRGIEIFEYAPTSIKKGITGRGAASKEEVRMWVLNTLGIPSNEKIDATDALAMAVYQATQFELREKFKRQGLEL